QPSERQARKAASDQRCSSVDQRKGTAARDTCRPEPVRLLRRSRPLGAQYHRQCYGKRTLDSHKQLSPCDPGHQQLSYSAQHAGNVLSHEGRGIHSLSGGERGASRTQLGGRRRHVTRALHRICEISRRRGPCGCKRVVGNAARTKRDGGELISPSNYDFLMEMADLPDISVPSLSEESPEFVRDRLPE